MKSLKLNHEETEVCVNRSVIFILFFILHLVLLFFYFTCFLTLISFQVREESADDFLFLLKEWKGLCVHFKVVKPDGSERSFNLFTTKNTEDKEEDEDEDEDVADSEVYEVEKILGIRYGKAKNKEEKELLFKVLLSPEKSYF